MQFFKKYQKTLIIAVVGVALFLLGGSLVPNFLKLGNLLIEVIPTEEPAMRDGAVDHLCLDVKQIDALYEQLKQAGYTMLSDSVNQIDFWDNGAKYFFIQGPNDEKIEFCEIL